MLPLGIENGPAEEPAIDVRSILRMLRRHWLLMAICAIVGLALAATYLVTATPLYTANTTVLLDSQMNDFLQKQNIAADSTVDTSLVDSQVEVLTSESIALEVIRRLHLDTDQEFVGAPKDLFAKVMVQVTALTKKISSLLGISGESGTRTEPPERAAVEVFSRRLSAKRAGLTYVIDIGFQSESPQKAMDIANAVARAYIADEIDAKFNATKQASSWLRDRLTELGTQATVADRAVQQFKTDHAIVDTGRGSMSQQQMADLTSQLVTAKGNTAEAKARLDRIQQVSQQDVPDTTVTDALSNPVITRLRAQYLDLQALAADMAARVGQNHIVVSKIRDQMNERKRSIAQEVQRIAAAFQSDYEIARARQASLEQNLSTMVGEAGDSGLAQVELRDLESKAESYRTLNDSFLQKLQEATQQQSSPVTNTRVITEAAVPTRKSSPKSALALAAGIFLGLCTGAAAGIARELMANFFRIPDDVIRILGTPCLGLLPVVKPKFGRSASRSLIGEEGGAGRAMCEFVLDSLFSRFSETLRNVKVSLDSTRDVSSGKVVGITSSLPREGKTTVACNLASLVANNGSRTLLIDGDLHQRTISTAMVPQAKEGLMEALADPSKLSSVIQTMRRSGLNVLPCVLADRIPNVAEVLGSRAMEDLLKSARASYDYIFIEFAPLVPVVDAKAGARLTDEFIFVVEWENTPQGVVVEALANADMVRKRLTGVVINNVDPIALRRMEKMQGKRYGNYYTTP